MKPNEDPEQDQNYSTSDSSFNHGRCSIEGRDATGAKSTKNFDENTYGEQRQPDRSDSHFKIPGPELRARVVAMDTPRRAATPNK
jgi:hypothetical protein